MILRAEPVTGIPSQLLHQECESLLCDGTGRGSKGGHRGQGAAVRPPLGVLFVVVSDIFKELGMLCLIKKQSSKSISGSFPNG